MAAGFVPLHLCHYLLFISKFFFFFQILYFILPVPAIVGVSELILVCCWAVDFVCVTFLCPGCILNVTKFLSTVKFVVLNWCSLAIAVLSGLSGVAATEYA